MPERHDPEPEFWRGCGWLVCPALPCCAGTPPQVQSLKVNSLPSPITIDDPSPHFSWVLSSPTRGVVASGYELEVRHVYVHEDGTVSLARITLHGSSGSRHGQLPLLVAPCHPATATRIAGGVDGPHHV